ncbi:MAG TPA: CPBP family intramembrane glutamic endopeptidase [Rhizomicrobium sp.]
MRGGETRFRLRLVPLLVVVLLGLGLPMLGAVIAQALSHVLPLPSARGPALPWLYSQHLFQTLLALVAIFAVKRLMPFDAGLRWPPGKTYLVPALLWGALFGVLMTLVDHAPDLIAHRAPVLDYPLTTANVVGWLGFEGIYVGPTEEILFRSLLVGYLIAAMPGKLRLGGFGMSWGGAIVALIFALAHAANFTSRPFFEALGQQLYAFALGILYAYWFEKSRSVLAPIVGHNAGDFVEYAIVFALVVMWR